MNFFRHQDDARRKSAQLVFLLCAAVFALIVITTIAVSACLYFLQGSSTSMHVQHNLNTTFLQHLLQILQSQIFFWIAMGVILVVSMGSLYKSSQLKQGGDYVAQALGGRILLREQANANEKRALNVVEEMAIASGMPVPRVYLLDSDGINAFAAGTNTSNAVIGLTKGSIQTFNREQLQGVIAHEFSHIHHGDMRLNMRLIALLHGILLIGLIGQVLLRSGAARSMYRVRRSDKKGNSAALLGLVLVAIGFGGVFFGRLIKSAVSRQREYLADASAVQYTRNPQGIAAALLTIKRSIHGSKIQSQQASEFSHFFFANGVRSFIGGMFATHPPLDERIKRIYPKGTANLERAIRKTILETEKASDAEFSSEQQEQDKTERDKSPKVNDLGSLIDQVGIIQPSSIDFSQALIATIPLFLQDACASPYQARAVVYSLLLDQDNSTRAKQMSHLAKRAHPATYKEFLKIHKHVLNLNEDQKFPLLQLAQPSLLNLSAPQERLFRENLLALAKADEKISLREWSILNYVLHAYETKAISQNNSVDDLKKEIAELLGFVCLLNETNQRQASLNKAMQVIWPDQNHDVKPSKLSLSQLNASLAAIKTMKPIVVPRLLKAMATCVSFDGQVTIQEKEILRTLSAVLDAPMPIIMPMSKADDARSGH